MQIELGEFQVTVTNVRHFGGTPAKLSGHPDSWEEGEGGELTYDLVDVTRYGDEQDDIQVLTPNERTDWLGDHYEDLDAAILKELP